jgi:hypothetical protein
MCYTVLNVNTRPLLSQPPDEDWKAKREGRKEGRKEGSGIFHL